MWFNSEAFALGVLTLLSAVFIVLVWQVFATARARASAAREEAYRKLAEEVGEVLRKTTEAHQKLAEDLAELRVRTSAIESLLREVE